MRKVFDPLTGHQIERSIVNKEAIAVLIEYANLVEKEMGFEGNYPVEYSIYLGGYKFLLWDEEKTAEMIKIIMNT